MKSTDLCILFLTHHFFLSFLTLLMPFLMPPQVRSSYHREYWHQWAAPCGRNIYIRNRYRNIRWIDPHWLIHHSQGFITFLFPSRSHSAYSSRQVLHSRIHRLYSHFTPPLYFTIMLAPLLPFRSILLHLPLFFPFISPLLLSCLSSFFLAYFVRSSLTYLLTYLLTYFFHSLFACLLFFLPPLLSSLILPLPALSSPLCSLS